MICGKSNTCANFPEKCKACFSCDALHFLGYYQKRQVNKIKIIIHLEPKETDEIIGIKEDFAAYCEKFGDVKFIEVERECEA